MTDFNDDIPDDIRQALKAAAPRPDEERVDRVWARLRDVMNEAVLGTGYAGDTAYASALRKSNPTIRRIAGRVFPSLATRRDVNRGVYSAGTLPRWVGYGALASCALAILAWQVFQPKLINTPSTPEAYTVYVTKPGQRASLTLSNGARVTLGPLTTLRVPKATASHGGIAVEVNGEALFNIAHSTKAPFTVTSHSITARVLGTEFIVRAYDASLVRIAVRDGRVAVQSPVVTLDNVTIVNAGEAVSAIPNGLPSVTPIADIATDFAWANGELVLRSVSLGEALVRLSRWYGMEFRVADPSLLKAKVNTVFPSAFNQEKIDVLGIAINAYAKRSGNIVTFYKTP